VHPNILKFFEGNYSQTEAFYVTECCFPLNRYVKTVDLDMQDNVDQLSLSERIWGLYNVIV
jgi:hypothetical protein